MKIISFFWAVLLLFPLIIISTVAGNFEKPDGTVYLLLLAVCLGCAFSGFIVSGFFYIRKIQKRWMLNVLMLLTGIIISAVINSIFHTGPLFFLLTLASYIIGFISLFTSSSSYSKSGFLIASILISSLLFPLFKESGLLNSHELLSVSMISETFIYIFLRNKKNIDDMMIKRKYNRKYLPKTVKKNNFIFAGSMCILIGVSLLFTNNVSKIISKLLKFLKALIKKKASSIDHEPEEAINDFSVPEELLVNDQTEKSSVMFWVLTWLVTAFFIFVIISNYDLILNAITRSFISVRKKIKSFFTRRSELNAESDASGYSDTLEDIEKIPDNTDGQNLSLRKWKKSYSVYKTLPAGEDKYRFGYKLMLGLLRISGTKINAPDTPDERASMINENSFSKVTEAYDNVRYGNGSCSQSDIDHLDSTISRYRKHIR